MRAAARCCSWMATASMRLKSQNGWSITGSRTATTSSTRPRRIATTSPSSGVWVFAPSTASSTGGSRQKIPEDAGDFRLLSPRAAAALRQLPERNRFFKGLATWIGFRQIRVDYEPEARAHGVTTFSPGRLLGLSIEGLTSFSVAPLRVASLLGVLLATVAFLFGLSILWETVVSGKSVPGYPSLVVGLMTIGGVQLIMIGVMGEYIGKILSEIKARPIYFVAEHSVKSADAPSVTDKTPQTAAE